LSTEIIAAKAGSKTAGVKIPPHSIEAEQSLIGGILLDTTAWDRVNGRIYAADFYRADHRLIFQAIDELVSKNKPVDVLTVADLLKGRQALENAGGEVYLFELVKNTPTAANIVAYADIVRERSVLRRLISAAGSIADDAFSPNGRETRDIVDEAERRIFEIAEKDSATEGPVALPTWLGQAMERIDTLYRTGGAITGTATGFKDLDQLTTGLQASDLIIIAGRPSMGKTMLGVNIAEQVALQNLQQEQKKPVLIFSLEMPGDAIAMRMLSSLGRINHHKLRTGDLSDEDWSRIGSNLTLLSETQTYIDDTPGLTPTEVRSRARRLAREHGQLGLVLVDYLQLMHVPGFRENRNLEISEISRALKSLAKELKVPVIALSQLNRSLEQRSDKRPVMSDLRESGAIEQDADLIAFIYRDEVYDENSPDKGIAEIIIGKHRNGPIGKIRLAFLGQYMRFDNLSYEPYREPHS
jgi:replicative DNA helicase